MTATLKLIYNLSRYWRCYFLLCVASILTFILIFISKNDPNLEHYFPYFRGGSNYNYYFSNVDIKEISKMMQKNILDYPFMNLNSRFCLKNKNSVTKLSIYNNNNKQKKDDDNKIKDEQKLRNDLSYFLSEDFLDESENAPNDKQKNRELDFILLSISRAENFKHRLAARSTWAKSLKSNTKLVFIIGNPIYNEKDSFKSEERSKLSLEIKDYQDIVQIDMPDGENFTSTKILLALSWSLTYCSFAKNIFILSDSAVLNHNRFDQFVKQNKEKEKYDDKSLIGYCNHTDVKLAKALKYFYANIIQKSSKNPLQNSAPRNTSFETYVGEFCSNLGWLMSLNAAKQLWLTALRTPFIMQRTSAFLNGFLAHKANLEQLNRLTFNDYFTQDTNCLKSFENDRNLMLCAENFTQGNRYASYIARWNSGSHTGLGILVNH
jgi:hypothetical protein